MKCKDREQLVRLVFGWEELEKHKTSFFWTARVCTSFLGEIPKIPENKPQLKLPPGQEREGKVPYLPYPGKRYLSRSSGHVPRARAALSKIPQQVLVIAHLPRLSLGTEATARIEMPS